MRDAPGLKPWSNRTQGALLSDATPEGAVAAYFFLGPIIMTI
jgi:hypothetical protein